MNQIELEHRALVTEKKYRELLAFLAEHGKDLRENNKHTFHFIFPDKLLNVIDLESKGQAKIALKLGKIGQGAAFEEIEVPIEQKDFEKTARLFKALGHSEIIESHQTRHDFEYKGVELAVKHSEEWGYHVELEMLLSNRAEVDAAEQKIKAVADELGLKIMTEEELTALVNKIESAHRAKNNNA